ncbi:hypothetical protein WG66_006091, partial [Moniliophthora roreri]
NAHRRLAGLFSHKSTLERYLVDTSKILFPILPLLEQWVICKKRRREKDRKLRRDRDLRVNNVHVARYGICPYNRSRFRAHD